MGAPAGNQFWKLRSKHGRDRLFESPELLWDAACEYFEWCEKNPLIEVDFRGKDANLVRIPKMRAFTMIGLCHFLDCNEVYFNQFESSLKERGDEISKDFSKIATRIKEVVRRQKFEGAAAGFLNASIIARDLGLVDKSETDLSSKGKEMTSLNITFVPRKDANI